MTFVCFGIKERGGGVWIVGNVGYGYQANRSTHINTTMLAPHERRQAERMQLLRYVQRSPLWHRHAGLLEERRQDEGTGKERRFVRNCSYIQYKGNEGVINPRNVMHHTYCEIISQSFKWPRRALCYVDRLCSTTWKRAVPRMIVGTKSRACNNNGNVVSSHSPLGTQCTVAAAQRRQAILLPAKRGSNSLFCARRAHRPSTIPAFGSSKPTYAQTLFFKHISSYSPWR